ncbi:hypothetical protein QBC39DRAFT_269741 [Podospora conica]|nr:hypothetical protein QBC39DRAFT_269741 [Schizothecium conicum]
MPIVEDAPVGFDEAAHVNDDRQPMLLGIHWGLTALGSVLLALRIYCKQFHPKSKRGLWWDDYILIAGWLCIIATDIITTVLAKWFGMGRHSWQLTIYDPQLFLIILNARAVTTLSALCLTKTSFAVTLLRLTTEKTKAFVWFIIISLNILLGFSAAIPFIQCDPIAKTWNNALDGKCWAPGVGVKIWIATGAYSAFMDFVLAGLPWTFLFGIMLRKKEKFGILIAMSCGVIAGAVGIIKCVELPHLGKGDAYNDAILFIWDITESNACLMAACIPALRVLFRDVSSTAGGSSSGTSRLPSNLSFSFSRKHASKEKSKGSGSGSKEAIDTMEVAVMPRDEEGNPTKANKYMYQAD